MVVGILQQKKVLCSFSDLRQRAREIGPKRVGVVEADDDVVLQAASQALRSHIALPVLIGEERRIRERVERLGLPDLQTRASFVEAGQDAAEALAEGALRVLRGEEAAREFGDYAREEMGTPAV